MNSRGFTLLELAIVLVVLTVLGSGALGVLRAQSEATRRAETRAGLLEAREALTLYAAVQGSLPCPDTSGDGEPDACPANGVAHGALPWARLGVPGNDAWGQPLQYAVHTAFTAPLRLDTAGQLEIVGAETSNPALANPASVALALWSRGPDGVDATRTATASRLTGRAPGRDDELLWLSRFVLLGRLIEAGRDLQQ